MLVLPTKKKSPRAPSISLADAIERTEKIYEKDRCHAAPIDSVAQHMGYKNAGSGAALQAIASLKYYSLIDRLQEGSASVSREFESYKYAPDEHIKQELLIKWLKSPQIFTELIDLYPDGLPSDQTIKYELIRRGFSPSSADGCLAVFRESVDFAHYYERNRGATSLTSTTSVNTLPTTTAANEFSLFEEIQEIKAAMKVALDETYLRITSHNPSYSSSGTNDNGLDRIPVRLGGGRRAWIEIPTPFFESDKSRLINQIKLLLTEEDEDKVENDEL